MSQGIGGFPPENIDASVSVCELAGGNKGGQAGSPPETEGAVPLSKTDKSLIVQKQQQ